MKRDGFSIEDIGLLDHSVEKAGSPPILTSSQFSDPFSKHSASTLDSSDKGSNSFWNKIG
jgi:hypothetical protein